jgi:hypothetical protein
MLPLQEIALCSECTVEDPNFADFLVLLPPPLTHREAQRSEDNDRTYLCRHHVGYALRGSHAINLRTNKYYSRIDVALRQFEEDKENELYE